MNRHAIVGIQAKSEPSAGGGVLQRKCACGQHTIAGAECQECREKKASLPPATELLQKKQDSRFGYDFSRVPVSMQHKLTISRPDDLFEREADQIAERVIHSASGSLLPIRNTGSRLLQKQDASVEADDEEGAEEYENAEPVAEELTEPGEPVLTGDETGRPKMEPGSLGSGKTRSVSLPRGTGRPLDGGVQSFMEQRMGHELGHVRIHTDSESTASAEDLSAQAYTVGSDIYFNEWYYDPGSLAGKRLLAHELAHVIQQTGSRSGGASTGLVQRQRERTRRRPHGPRDAPHGAGQRRRRGTTQRFCHKSDGRNCAVPCGPSSCDNQCAGAVNHFAHNPCCGNETCAGSGPADASNFIRHLDLNLSTQQVEAELGTRARTAHVVGPFLSSPNPSVTPQGSHTIGEKCGPCHTNCDGHGMAWFSSFHNGLEFGFHNSQRVAVGTRSLGCARVPCDRAHWIHDNTWSGTTTVCVHTGSHCGRPRRRSAAPGGASTPGAHENPLVSENEPSTTGNAGTGAEQSGEEESA